MPNSVGKTQSNGQVCRSILIGEIRTSVRGHASVRGGLMVMTAARGYAWVGVIRWLVAEDIELDLGWNFVDDWVSGPAGPIANEGLVFGLRFEF